MSKQVNWISEAALLLAGGLLAASVSRARHRSVAGDARDAAPEVSQIHSALGKLERRVAEEAATSAVRFQAIEARLDEQSARLAEIPAIRQIISAVEDTLTRAMAPLNERLSGQDQVITGLKAAVGRNDRLLDRVLEIAKQTREATVADQTAV